MNNLDYIEYHIAHHCNLNCKGCGHLSNIVRKPLYGDLKQFEKDLNRLSELFENINNIRLMGGEPLLNFECPSFVKIARRIFPKSNLFLVTNGLLLLTKDSCFFDVIKSNNCIIQVSVYEPVKKIINELKDICQYYNVEVQFLNNKEEFYKKLDLKGNNNPKTSFKTCYSNKCTYLENGKISSCCSPLVVHHLNDTFNTNIMVSKDDYIELYDDELTGDELLQRLKKYKPFCRYCSEKVQYYQWQSSDNNVTINDWIID